MTGIPLRRCFGFFVLIACLISPPSLWAFSTDADETSPAIAAGKEHSVVLCSDGTVWAWGDNSFGQLGDGTIQSRSRPVRAGELDEVVAIAAGDYHTIALRSDGTVWAWGDNSYGQLGIKRNPEDTDTFFRWRPTEVKYLTNVTAIAAGARHCLALRADGTVRAWGDNSYGQLGDGTTENRESPRQVFYLNSTEAISASGFNSAALMADGTIRTWGANWYGQLGDGRRSSIQSTPVKVADFTSVTCISVGREQMIALKSDGTVWAWGNNTSGQLGDGTRISRLRPVKVLQVENAVSVSAGELHALALTGEGMIWTWGDNSYGQLGDGTTMDRPIPKKQKDLPKIAGIAAGEEHSLAVDDNGMIWAWGSNWSGYLGNGTTESSLSPVQTLQYTKRGRRE